ncbi:unnamed protein product [Trichogramma brassicae]|uniref:Uncharacterized protein n=1 Tax=Trichogramma brassicae TaxID=86971 RepID=A0A6H5IHJ3_9HYME|nr:unnamed protein product [Trichogramma brassicae]
MEPMKIHLDALEMAGKMVDKHIVADSNFPSLINLMRYNVQGNPTVSGLDVYDYPNLNGTSMNMQCHCMMGLFTDISKAWLTIDSDIYVWSYENESDVAYFDGLNETIISVGLVKPKPGIFQSYVKYLLVLTTTVEITVLGVTLTDNEDGSQGEMQLVPEPIFTVTTDGIAITTIANTNSGRIFLGGRNGSLYEIYYQAESSWFGKRCKKINHSEGPFSFLVPSFVSVALSDEEAIVQISVDDSRSILYTLGDKGTITVWDIDSGGASKITSMSQATLVQNSVHVVKTLDSNNFRPLVSISAINESESLHLNLVAVAATGTRFYFSCTSSTNPMGRPQCLQLIHVRLPPGYAANAPVMRPRKVQMAHYRKGTLILTCGGDTESAWCLSNDAYPFSNCLAETQSILPLDSPVWALAEIPGESAIQIEKQIASQGDPPLLVRQHMEPPRKFIFLTAQGAIVLIQVRPVDILRQLLLEQRGPDTEAVKAYFQTQSPEQACATCLILATLESSQNAQLAEWATRAFFLYGSQRLFNGQTPELQSPFSNITVNLLTNDIRTSTPRLPYFDNRSQMMRTPQNPQNGGAEATGLQQFSAKHGGLYLYIGRILRPIWNLRCIKQDSNQAGKTQIFSTVNSTQVGWILGHLQALRSFLNKNTHISKSHGGMRNINDGFDNTTIASQYQEPIVEERNSLDALKIFITHACEILGLWKILCENQLHNIVSCLSKDQVSQFMTATFRDLILIGHEISSLLIIHLIDSYLGDNASVDSVSAKLREICPNLYRSEDAVCSKSITFYILQANEIILKAKNCTNPEEKESFLQSALKLCKEVAPRLNIGAVCQQFVACHFYRGVLELCLCCADKVDPNNAALHYYKNNEPIEDQEGSFSYMKRIEASLPQRVEYLARAVVCMRSDQAGYAPHLGVFLRELEDKVEVARIQQQLYEEFAEPLQLWECKLAIIHCSGHQDVMLIQGIWKNIIETELKNAPTSADDKLAIITSKIKLLGQEYRVTPHCFPVDFLLKELEIRACRLKISNDHIITCFLQLNIPIEELLDHYDRMIGGNNRTWLNEGNEFHLIESAANLVNYFITNSNITNAFIRRKIITRCQDVISKCLTTLFSKPNGGDLITKLRSIQSVLNRL